MSEAVKKRDMSGYVALTSRNSPGWYGKVTIDGQEYQFNALPKDNDPEAWVVEGTGLSGQITVNQKSNEKQPDFRGRVKVKSKNKDYLFALWKREDKPDLLSLRVTDPDTLPQRAPVQNDGPSISSAQSSSSQTQTNGPDLSFGIDDIFGPLS